MSVSPSVMPSDTPPALVAQRLRSATTKDRNGKRRNALSAYLHLIEDKSSIIPLVWFLQAVRQAPVLIFTLLMGHVFFLINSAPSRVTHELWWILATTFLLCVLNVIATVGQQRVRSVHRRNLTASLRRALAQRLHQLALSFHDRSSSGVLQNKFILDLNRLEDVHNYLAENIILQGTTVLASLIMVALINPWFLIIIAIVIPANLIAAHVLWDPMRQRSEEFRKAESGMLSYLQEVLHGLRLTRAHAVEEFAEQRLTSSAQEVAKRGIRVDITCALFGSTGWAIGSLLNMLVIGIGAWLCVKDTIRVDQLFVFYTFYGLIQGGISGIVNGMPAIVSASDALNSLAELYDDEVEETNVGKTQMPPMRGTVSLNEVSFTYPGSERPSLNQVSLKIPVGGTLALVGASGSGKSTLANLILGFYEPQKGSILIDGYDLRTLDRRSLRKQVGVVSQDVVLFQDTVLGNIAWGDAAIDESRVIQAAKRANADQFINALPLGYQTVLGDRGIGLSGGQRQRLAIARALYRDPRLLILDEATSALDPESERQVQMALDELMRGRTTLIIAHRLSTVRNADSIAVLENGMVSEQGTFAQLMDRRLSFFRLANGQLV